MLIKRKNKPHKTSHESYRHIIGNNGEDIQEYSSSSSYTRKFSENLNPEFNPLKRMKRNLLDMPAGPGAGIKRFNYYMDRRDKQINILKQKYSRTHGN